MHPTGSGNPLLSDFMVNPVRDEVDIQADIDIVGTVGTVFNGRKGLSCVSFLSFNFFLLFVYYFAF